MREAKFPPSFGKTENLKEIQCNFFKCFIIQCNFNAEFIVEINVSRESSEWIFPPKYRFWETCTEF